MDISVIICTCNRVDNLRRALDSFRGIESEGLEWELIVVDNNSTDHTRKVIEEFASSVEVSVRYLFEARQGKSYALNAGVPEAQGKIIALTDDDVVVDPGWLKGIRAAFDQFDCGAVAGKVIAVWGRPKPEWLEMALPEMPAQQAIVSFDLGDQFKPIRGTGLGANLAFRKEVFARHGLFRVDLGASAKERMACEDTELQSRLVRAGEKIMYSPHAIIWHPVDPERTTKEFFCNWHFIAGRSQIRMEGWPKTVCYFGVPRFLYRRVMTYCAKWIFGGSRKSRLINKFRTYKEVGMFVEAYRVSKSGQLAQQMGALDG